MDRFSPATHEGRVLAILLGTWFMANALTHVIVAVTTGGIYSQLPFLGLLRPEASISIFNFLFPILAVRYVLKEALHLPEFSAVTRSDKVTSKTTQSPAVWARRPE